MSEHLILVRHSAVQIDTAVPSHQWPLSADGRSRCHSLAPKLTPYNPTRFITSEEPKAIETGQILADALAVSAMSASGLQEHDRHGTPYFESREAFETAVQQELSSHPQETLAIVSHGTVMTLFICHHNPHLNPMQFWQSLTLPCAFVLRLPEMQLVTAV